MPNILISDSLYELLTQSAAQQGKSISSLLSQGIKGYMRAEKIINNLMPEINDRLNEIETAVNSNDNQSPGLMGSLAQDTARKLLPEAFISIDNILMELRK